MYTKPSNILSWGDLLQSQQLWSFPTHLTWDVIFTRDQTYPVDAAWETLHVLALKASPSHNLEGQLSVGSDVRVSSGSDGPASLSSASLHQTFPPLEFFL